MMKTNDSLLAPATATGAVCAGLNLDAHQKNLDQERNHFRNLAESVPVGVLCANMAGQASFVNQEWLKVTGRTAEEVRGNKWIDIIHPLDREQFDELKDLALAEGKPVHLECRLQRQPDSETWIYITATAELLDNGQPNGMIYCLIDLTERKNSLQQIERAQRLHSIGVLAGGIAHDLNNALTPVLVGLETLKMRCPEQSKLLEGIHTSANHGAGIVKQLMTFAKGADGERVPIQLRHLLRDVEKIINSTFPKNIRFNLLYTDKTWMVVGDPTQLQQVIINLCVNARDAMPGGGTLTIELDSQDVDGLFAGTVSGAKPGKYVAIKVRDTGCGIRPEIIDRIFDPFFTTKTPDKGTGLGLSTALGIVRGHEGFMQVYTQVGKGTTFGVYIPADRPSSDTKFIRKSDVLFRGHGETILFVDDEPLVREVVSEVLQRLNFKPVLAVDGADGLVKAMEHLNDLAAVITDMHMPHMDGLGLVFAVRRIKPHLPALIVSGRLDDPVKAQMDSLNAGGCLQKPFTESQLVDTLRQILVEAKTEAMEAR